MKRVMSQPECVQYVQGLLFPAGESTPQTVWIPYTEEEDMEWPFSNTPSHSLDCSAWLASANHIVEKEIKRHGSTGRALSRTLLVLHENGRFSGSRPVNRCVDALTGGQFREWRGNIVVVRAVEPTSTLTQYCDASMEDMDAVVSWLDRL